LALPLPFLSGSEEAGIMSIVTAETGKCKPVSFVRLPSIARAATRCRVQPSCFPRSG
jgi:hypothetical protein